MVSKKKAIGATLGAKAATKAARGAGKVALKGGKAQAKLARQAVSSQEPVGAKFLKYGFFALVGFVVGALVARSGKNEGESSSFTGTTGQHTPDFGSPAGQRGETWGSGSSLGASGASSGVGQGTQPESGVATPPLQRPEDTNRTGSERDYSDPSSGPLIGRTHRGIIGDVPVQEQEVENRIRTNVGEDSRTRDLPHLNVEVNDGIAEIRGLAHTEEEKQAVQEIASSVEGVTEVRNLLTVDPDAPARRDRSGSGEPEGPGPL
ncbi:MAG: BON domain-containing protein [Actinomycetota bacterium]|jgi:hypothetical protein|nr:BON domain-containing protein [Actinomycetota bacterium]